MNKKLERCEKCVYYYCNPNVKSASDFKEHPIWIRCKHRRFFGCIETIFFNDNRIIYAFLQSAKKFIKYPKCFKAKETSNESKNKES